MIDSATVSFGSRLSANTIAARFESAFTSAVQISLRTSAFSLPEVHSPSMMPEAVPQPRVASVDTLTSFTPSTTPIARSSLVPLLSSRTLSASASVLGLGGLFALSGILPVHSLRIRTCERRPNS